MAKSTSVCVVALLFVSCWGASILRVPLKICTVDPAAQGRGLVGEMSVDGEKRPAIVDTASPFLSFVWKYWYEKIRRRRCADVIFGCYDCDPKVCPKKDTKTFSFADGSAATLFSHKGKVTFEGKPDVEGIIFGLISDYKFARESVPRAILGLGFPRASAAPYVPLVNQLLAQPPSRRLIDSPSFSMYIKESDSTGELILGGVDPQKYVSPMLFTPILSPTMFVTKLAGVKVMDDEKRVLADAEFDTGADGIFMDAKSLEDLIKSIKAKATRPVNIYKIGREYQIDCGQMDYLPPVTLLFKGDTPPEEIELEIKGANYVEFWTQPVSKCVLLFFEDDSGTWSIGYNVLVGHYLFYDVERKRAGIAKAK